MRVAPPRKVLVRGMWGLGDNIFARPFVAAASRQYDLWLDTPWPELYADLDIKFVRGTRKLRTQQNNMARQDAGIWSTPPRGIREVKVSYSNLGAWSIVQSLERHWRAMLGVGLDPQLLTLPEMGAAPVVSNRPIAVVRPVTVRSEWRNEARNPEPEYVNAIAATLMTTHTVVAVADLADGQEWLVGELPRAHQYLVRGQLKVRELLALVRDADVVVGGVGWIVPAALALKTKTFVVLGGHGGHNAPEKITDPRLDVSRIGFAMPEEYCRCTNMLHDCEKMISDPVGRFRAWQSSCPATASLGGHSSASAITRSGLAPKSTTIATSTISSATPTVLSGAP